MPVSQYLRLPLGVLVLYLLISLTFRPPSAEQQIVESVKSVTAQYKKLIEWAVEETVRKVVENLDTNGDGFIEMSEMQNHALTAAKKLKLSAPSPREVGAALSHFTFVELMVRYFFLQMTFLAALFVFENVRCLIFRKPQKLLLDNSYITSNPPEVGADIALTYDTPWTTYERAKLIFFLVTGLLFVRIFFLVFFALISMAMVNFACWQGRTRRDNPRWFRCWTNAGCFFAHCASAAIGVSHVKLIGKMADRSECKILIGNHSCIMEVVVLFILGDCPSFVTRKENTKVPLFNGVAAISDAIVVDRDAAKSRQQTLDAIFTRAKNRDPNGPQLVVFPEGTTTNQRALFMFKKGAFEAAEPVQMICVSFPYRHFNPCWTGRACGGNSIHDLFIRIASQFVNYVEVRILPVYHPTDEERNDPVQYAAHCQKMMAATLQCGISAFSYRDYEALERQKKEEKGAKND